MANILITDGMDKNSAQELSRLGHKIVEQFYKPEELMLKIRDCDALIVRSATKVTKPVIDGALETKRLKLIIRAGVGVDNIDVAYATQNGIRVENTPCASSAAVAELAVAHMFTLARHLHQSNVTMKNGEWNKKAYTGIELSGKTLGLIGMGRIARETARRADALGMKICYTCRSGKKDDYPSYEYLPLEELLRTSDFISLHIPFNKNVGPVIGKAEIGIMKDGAFLINCARGGVVDEEALLEGLDSGKLAGAGIDVFKDEPSTNMKLLQHKNVSLSPHIGACTEEAQSRIGAEIVEIVKKYC